MPDDLKCSRCDSRELTLISEEKLFFVYKCKHCQTLNRVGKPPAPSPAVSNLDQAIRDLSSTIIEWKNGTQRDELFHRMEEERRHLELRLDTIENHFLDVKHQEPTPKMLIELDEIQRKRIQLFEEIHKCLMETMQLTQERKIHVQILTRAIKNTNAEINVVNQRSMSASQSDTLKLTQRLHLLKSLKLEIEVFLIRKNFPILDKIPSEAARLVTWENYLKDLNNDLQRVKKDYSPSEARQVVADELRRRISKAATECDRIRTRQLEHMLATQLDAGLPDNLGDLGREMEKIDKDMRTLRETRDPLAAEIITRLGNRRTRVVAAIKFTRFRQESKSLWETFKDWLGQLFGLIDQ